MRILDILEKFVTTGFCGRTFYRWAVFFAILGISLTYAVMYSRMVVIMMATAISVCRGSVMCWVLFSGFS